MGPTNLAQPGHMISIVSLSLSLFLVSFTLSPSIDLLCLSSTSSLPLLFLVSASLWLFLLLVFRCRHPTSICLPCAMSWVTQERGVWVAGQHVLIFVGFRSIWARTETETRSRYLAMIVLKDNSPLLVLWDEVASWPLSHEHDVLRFDLQLLLLLLMMIVMLL